MAAAAAIITFISLRSVSERQRGENKAASAVGGKAAKRHRNDSALQTVGGEGGETASKAAKGQRTANCGGGRRNGIEGSERTALTGTAASGHGGAGPAAGFGQMHGGSPLAWSPRLPVLAYSCSRDSP